MIIYLCVVLFNFLLCCSSLTCISPDGLYPAMTAVLLSLLQHKAPRGDGTKASNSSNIVMDFQDSSKHQTTRVTTISSTIQIPTDFLFIATSCRAHLILCFSNSWIYNEFWPNKERYGVFGNRVKKKKRLTVYGLPCCSPFFLSIFKTRAFFYFSLRHSSRHYSPPGKNVNSTWFRSCKAPLDPISST